MTSAAPFEYQTADCWEEAVELAGIWGEDGKVLAGGQSLVPMLNLRLARPAALIDINPIPAPEPGLDGGTLVIPALTRHRQLLRSPVVAENCPLLAAAVGYVGNVRVRARGTIGGSVSHADPTGEIPCVLAALDGQIVAQGPQGRRIISAAEFFVSYLTTSLQDGELVTEVRLPARGRRDGTAFAETVRRASDFAMVAVAASVRLAADARTVTSATAVVAGVTDKPFPLGGDVLAPLAGATGTEEELRAVGAAAAGSVSPESDVHASGAYRKRLTDVLTRRTLAAAIADARSAWN